MAWASGALKSVTLHDGLLNYVKKKKRKNNLLIKNRSSVLKKNRILSLPAWQKLLIRLLWQTGFGGTFGASLWWEAGNTGLVRSKNRWEMIHFIM